MRPVETRYHVRSPAQAEEPRSYDRRFYARVLLAAFIVIILCIVLVTYLFVVDGGEKAGPARFDLSSLFTDGSRALPDPHNPCMVLQEYLELTSRKSYERAYDYLSEGLKKEVSLDEFVSNSEKNSLLFNDVERYRFSQYTVEETAATANGYMEYGTGGRSLVEVAFAKEDNGWRIALVTVVYQ